MYSYTAYGLCVHSVLPLPDLSTIEAAPDVTVRLAKVDRTPTNGAASGHGWWATAQEVCLYYEQIGATLVREGQEMLVDPDPDQDKDALRGLILGAPLAMLLHQRGLLVLHASAVNLDGAAVAFLGDSGLGKSTIAATLHVHGHGVLADDLVVVGLSDEGIPTVLPAFPQLKLSPQVVASLGQDPETLPRVYPGEDKRVYRVDEGFPAAPVPLKCIYVLGAGTCPEIEPLGFQETILQLVRHSYAVHLLRATGTAPRHFRQCAALARSVPVSRLKRRQSLASLSDLAALIEAHCADRLSRPDLLSRIPKDRRAP